MFVIAVTGGMGSGKSLACEYFKSRGAIVISLDDIARRTMDPGGPAYDRLIERFGEEILEADGSIDRGGLATLVFTDETSLAELNRIVHPVVIREVMEGIANLRLLERPPRVVVLEVPLLVETPVFRDIADMVLAIDAPVAQRLQRSVAAGGRPRTTSAMRSRIT
jgi:dephospho-CoA kinase